MKVTLRLRREQGYLSAQASTKRKVCRLSLPFYSIEFFSLITRVPLGLRSRNFVVKVFCDCPTLSLEYCWPIAIY